MSTNGKTAGVALAIAALGLVASASSLAASGDHATHREHGAHEHGHGTLQVAVDGQQLIIELTVPADNVVGFEHRPSDDAQRQKVRAALVTFRDGAALFSPSPSAGCAIESSEATLAGMEDDAEKPAGTDHDHDHSSSGHSLEEGHSELRSRYVYRCTDTAALEGVEVRLFEHLLDVEELDAQVVTPSLQTATELRPGSTVLTLSR